MPRTPIAIIIILALAMSASVVRAEAEISGFKVRTLGKNDAQQVMVVSFYLEYRGACSMVIVEAEALDSSGQTVTTAMIAGQCSGPKGVFTSEVPIPYEKFERIVSWRMKSATSTPRAQ